MTFRIPLVVLLVCLCGSQANAQVKIVMGKTKEEKEKKAVVSALATTIAKLRAQPGMTRYLTPTGQLTQAIIVRDELVGFGVFAGTIWQINPNGSYVVTHIARRKRYLGGRGVISQQDLLKLAVILNNNDPLSLPSGGRAPNVNPHRTTVINGGNAAVLYLGVDRSLPAVDATKPAVNVFARYAGIMTAVQRLARANILARPPVPGNRIGARMGAGR